MNTHIWTGSKSKSATPGETTPEREAQAWAENIARCARLKSAYQDQQAAGLMTLEELSAKLRELEEIRLHAERELAAVRDSQTRVEELELDRDTLLESLSGQIPDSLDRLDAEERNTVYRMLRLEVTPTPEGHYEVSGAFCTAEHYQLKERGELANTYLFFTSDNGYEMGEHRLTHSKRRPMSPSAYRSR